MMFPAVSAGFPFHIFFSFWTSHTAIVYTGAYGSSDPYSTPPKTPAPQTSDTASTSPGAPHPNTTQRVPHNPVRAPISLLTLQLG
jgi:hypothetical protein